MAWMSVLLIVVGTQVFSKNTTVEETVKRAQAQFLEENRGQAIALLTQAMKTEKRDSPGFRKLSKALVQVAETFLSEKAQQLFELSRSLRGTDPQTALEKLKAAKDLEPDNELILRGMAIAMLGLGECEKARTMILQALERNPFSEAMIFYRLQSSICLRNLVLLKADLAEPTGVSLETYKQSMASEVEFGNALIQWKEGRLETALKHLEKAQLLDVRLLEVRWVTHQIYQAAMRTDLGPLKEYIEMCEKQKGAKSRDLELFPRNCADSRLAQEEFEGRGKQ